MDATRLHEALLAIGEQILATKAETSALDGEMAKLEERRAALGRKLQDLTAKHLTMVSSFAAPTNRSQSVLGLPPPHPTTRLMRILHVLVEGPMDAKALAEILGDDAKQVYMTLQDMKRRRELVDGPEDGKWSISDEGRVALDSDRSATVAA